MFRWYYGPNQGTPSAGVLSYLNNFYSGIHMAGPKLTPQTFQAGLYSKPLMGGAKEGAVSTVVNGYGPREGMAYPAFSSSGTDASLWWWNPDVEGFSNIFRVNGKGKAMWVDGGKRYLPGDLPEGDAVLRRDEGDRLPARDRRRPAAPAVRLRRLPQRNRQLTLRIPC